MKVRGHKGSGGLDPLRGRGGPLWGGRGGTRAAGPGVGRALPAARVPGQDVADGGRMAVAEPEPLAPGRPLTPASPTPERLNGKVPRRVSKTRGRRAQHRLAQTAAYGLLLIGTMLFILPFLWMVSGSF